LFCLLLALLSAHADALTLDTASTLLSGEWVLRPMTLEFASKDKVTSLSFHHWSLVLPEIKAEDASSHSRVIPGKWFQNNTATNSSIDDHFMSVELERDLDSDTPVIKGSIRMGADVYEMKSVFELDLFSLDNGMVFSSGAFHGFDEVKSGIYEMVITPYRTMVITITTWGKDGKRESLTVWNGMRNDEPAQASWLKRNMMLIIFGGVMLLNVFLRTYMARGQSGAAAGQDAAAATASKKGATPKGSKKTK